MKECKPCGLMKRCRGIPGLCITLQVTFVTALVGVLSYLVVSQILVS
ncbi:MAG: hypothetical protein P8Y83_03390 [Gammaproteobacteria bacterium]|jgi:hypothetical protein|nr:hypothetical protein [Sedimenticolaceae bacterium]